MIWVKSGVAGEEALAKLLNNLQGDSRYGNWPDYVQVVVDWVNDGEIFYTVIWRQDELQSSQETQEGEDSGLLP